MGIVGDVCDVVGGGGGEGPGLVVAGRRVLGVLGVKATISVLVLAGKNFEEVSGALETTGVVMADMLLRFNVM